MVVRLLRTIWGPSISVSCMVLLVRILHSLFSAADGDEVDERVAGSVSSKIETIAGVRCVNTFARHQRRNSGGPPTFQSIIHVAVTVGGCERRRELTRQSPSLMRVTLKPCLRRWLPVLTMPRMMRRFPRLPLPVYALSPSQSCRGRRARRQARAYRYQHYLRCKTRRSSHRRAGRSRCARVRA
jgi:hypothetical protein